MRVLFTPGFTLTAAMWEPTIEAMGTPIEPVVAELPSDGDLVDAAQQLAHLAGRAVLVGYSMGGRVLLRAALDHPDTAVGLVLVAASPGIADAEAREERRRADERLADRIEQIGVDAFLAEWLAMPLFATLDPDAARLAERRSRTAVELASTLRRLGPGSQEPVWTRLAELACPALFVAGSSDVRYVEIAAAMAAAVGDRARVEVIEAAGHAVPLEAPTALAACLDTFVAELNGV